MIGKVLGHYRVLEKIGFGGMGEVYRASDERLGRDVALKLLKASLAHDQDRLRRFEQEARAAATLNHPNVVAVYDIGRHDGAPYIVSELLEGQTLRARLLDGPIPRRQVLDYASQIAHGLIAAHEKRIVHRDLKPENLFLTHDGRIKILDFGIAKLAPAELGSDSEDLSVANMTTQTRTGSVLGTLAYMSPEQLRGKVVDHRSDIFSFGAILYEMLTGKRAFAGETQVDAMTAILKEEPPEMMREGTDTPQACEKVVRHCLEKDPRNRFQSARDLAFALSTLSDATSRQVPAFRVVGPRLRRWLPVTAGALLMVAVAIYFGSRLRPAATPVYRRITFERGTVFSARFTPDGLIVYGAAWNGRPLQIYSTISDSLLARPLSLSSAYLLGVSSNNELALTLRGRPGSHLEFEGGMLARSPMIAGAPHEILQDVIWADWNPTAGDLAVVHHADGLDNLEYPVGNVLYRSSGSISNIRFSPKGDRIAFLDHPERWDSIGSVCVIDLAGHKTTLSSSWDVESGLAWSPPGGEVWFTALQSGTGSSYRSLWAVSLSGRQRKLLTAPGDITLQDIASDGRVLATVDSQRLVMEWSGKDKPVQDLSWYDWSLAKDISPDGQSVLFEEGGQPVGPINAVAVRKIDGSPPIRLGDGIAEKLSPDGRWAISMQQTGPTHLTLLPVGPGQARQIPLPGLERLQSGAHFLPDGKRIAINGAEPGRPGRTYIVDISEGKSRAVTSEGTFATFPSPDGKLLAGKTAESRIALFPVDGGPARLIPETASGYALMQWAADGQALYVYRPGDVPLKIQRLDIATGELKMVRELVPADLAGVVSIGPVIANRDASEFAYSYYQTVSVLYVISGLH